ncbi:MAG: late competence development ComFB family protein [Candidatus Goldbacteria bacterium]|nr:late competence development ComFB family protein [Candidatus Goldiibacteriota bacterium]
MTEKKEIIIKNYMEDIVRKNLNEQLEKRDDLCKCELCKNDIFAYSLNHLPPKYVVTDKGHIYTKLQEMEFQFNADVTREVLKAIEFVKKNKRHE